MIEKYYILIAEGITDCSLLEAILEKYLQYKAYGNVKELPLLFQEMIGHYPTVTGELRRQDSPVFYHKDKIAIAVKQAGGCTKLATQASSLVEIVDQLDSYDTFGGFLLFCDTDTENIETIQKRVTEVFCQEGFEYADNVLSVYGRQVLCKLHLFPTEGCGAIEKLLLECAAITYGDLTEDALNYRQCVLDDKYGELRSECWAKDSNVQEFYADKVQFGAISTVLKPDKPVRFSIKDKIIRTKYKKLYMKIPEFEVLYTFLLKNLK